MAWLYYRIRRPFWTWRPGRPWCSTCWRWTAEPHRHFRLTVDTSAFEDGLRKAQAALECFALRPHMGTMARALKAAADYERSMNEVSRLARPTGQAAQAMREAGILNEDGTSGESQDRAT